MRYCNLCGIPITRQLREPWLKEFRADCNWDDVRLSGVGICDEYDDVVTGTVPVDSRRRYDDHVDPDSMIDVSLMRFNLRALVSPGTSVNTSWGWGFHSSCWNLFTTGFTPNLDLLFKACLSMPIGEEVMDWGHDYGGAAALDWSRAIPIRCSRFPDCNSIPKQMISDPFEIPNLTRAIRRAARLQNDVFLSRLSLDHANLEQDGFSRLSPELLQIIATMLPSRDVRSLRLASPVFATLSLSEKFWASRFEPGNEFDDVPEVHSDPPESWRALYLSLQTWGRDNPHMANRTRVWKLAKRLQATIDQMEGVPCDGSPLKTWFEPLVQDESSKDRSWRTAARGISDIRKKFDHGSRVLRARALYFLQPLQIQHMSVSFVDTAGGRFVSGLQFVDKEGQPHAIGYLHPDQGVSIHLSSSQRIQGWELALDLSGVRGIAIIAEDGTRSAWVGEPGDFPRWHLAEAEGIFAVKAEFDALKLVSLSRDISGGASAQRQWRNSCLWYPDVPPDKRLLFNGSDGDEPPNGRVDHPVTTLFFSGSGGRPQSNLVEIVVWTFDLCHIAGIEFLSADPSSNQSLGQPGPFGEDHPAPPRFDRSEGRRISMSIDGRGGEELKSLEIQEDGGYVVGLKIHTNFGRGLTSPQNPYTIDNEWTVVEPAGSTVVGLFCTYGLFLYNLGLISTTLKSDAELDYE
ncbi:hypothetical protein FALBO_13427 [Fusarium albosuccineum]|uniref:DUF7600 domain-containing protein n=1 Tax=Fusarium albosuccineum TaxID=1237068 RepID=A0A8H4L187_9HYPO|nr:hypothetical protein FALBO_13427 [Fusarium albosuccineum]